MKRVLIAAVAFACIAQSCSSSKNITPVPGANPGELSVIAYYTGNDSLIDYYPVDKLTHIIYSFSHLKGNRLNLNRAKDTLAIQKLVSLKNRYPSLKVILSLGGWGGCETCSDVF